MSEVVKRLLEWQLLENDPRVDPDDIDNVLYMIKNRFEDYEPDALYPFLLRLEKWLDNLSTESDRKTAICALSNLFFVGRQEFESLYRTTLHNISCWLVDVHNLDLHSQDLDKT